ncbi:hypothetical protein EJ994_07885 [Maribacter sp. MJ134]|uniref:hypothetical protein n=1 Tax=Maribacter sp. MJ134 TaxID=2496865 RepID=UPI000F826069|nr:hypothetical protein [Maribacter sp. MJ134]AZQ58726.1 hypothetical protein EJ994_07885 [Maribacter sp. MJ134]
MAVQKWSTLFIILMVLFSCSSDDGGTPVVPESFLAIGAWDLTAVNINLAQDVNEDGTSSTNLIDELPCLSGLLTINSNNTWTARITDVSVTPVTGELYIIDCGNTLSFSGNWSNTGNTLSLNSSDFQDFTLSGDTLTENRGENLPGFLNFVYTKQ